MEKINLKNISLVYFLKAKIQEQLIPLIQNNGNQFFHFFNKEKNLLDFNIDKFPELVPFLTSPFFQTVALPVTFFGATISVTTNMSLQEIEREKVKGLDNFENNSSKNKKN